MSEEPTHGATTVRASKGGGGGKWLLGAAAAAVLLGGGYAAWKTFDPGQTNIDSAYNVTYSDDEPMRASPLDSDRDALRDDLAANESADESVAEPASTERRRTAPARRERTQVAEVPEETIGITPASATVDDSDEVIVRAPNRPVWVRTPSARRLSALYPPRALEDGREGEARLRCTVEGDGALDCMRLEESSRGFGSAAMRVSRTLRHASHRADGTDATGTPVNLRVVFRIEDEPRQRFASR